MTKDKIENNPIVRHSFEFALMITGYCQKLYDARKWDLSRQLFRSGTSIGANVWEAQSSESSSDFVHKMKIASKEANESLYWLMICAESEGMPDCTTLLTKLEEIQRLLNSIIATTKKKNTM